MELRATWEVRGLSLQIDLTVNIPDVVTMKMDREIDFSDHALIKITLRAEKVEKAIKRICIKLNGAYIREK